MKEIKLTQGKVALVDDEDFERLNQFKADSAYRKAEEKYFGEFARKECAVQ